MIALDCKACGALITRGRERVRAEIRYNNGKGYVCDKCAKKRKKRSTHGTTQSQLSGS
jgi:hypothetical protein